ncbi:hypothetical protein TNCV_1785311 [Trichonephila clavipes]|nr:hypothetical protein TNCV_1785311 [Trichonephila clavipes]
MDVSWVNVRFVIRLNVIVGLQCTACVPFCFNPSIPFFTQARFTLFKRPTSPCCFMNFLLPVSGVEPIPICLGGVLNHLTRCSTFEWCWNLTRCVRSRLEPVTSCMTIQKTVFGLDILPQLMENGFNLGDFRKMKRYDQKAYKLPPPTPAHVPAETNKRPLEEQPGPFSKQNRVFITPVIRPPVAPVLIARPSTALATPQPVIIPEPPVLTTPQILLSYPPLPPELTTPFVQLPDPPVQIPVFQPTVPTTPPV